MKLPTIFPIINTLSGYNKAWMKGDVGAGLTVGVMLIPQGMAYATIAGLPAIYGLYASLVPLVIYAILGSSRQLAVGPVAMVSLLTATAIGSFGEISLADYINYALLLALMVGVLQFLLGVFRLGFLVNFLSHPVISGFTSAAALIIGFSQLKHLLGIDIQRSHYVHEIVYEAFARISEINLVAFGIGIAGILIIIFLKRLHRAIPSQLFAVIFGICIVYFLKLEDGAHAVAIVGNIPSSLPSFVAPQFSGEVLRLLFPMALTIAVISFMESIAVAKAIQSKHRNYKVVPNQELVALGVSNAIGSLFQSYPTTGGFSRTAVNNQAGAKTTVASLVSAFLILLTLLFLTPLFYNLPKAILAAVIMVAVFGLIDIKEVKRLWRSDKTDFYLLIITFLATLGLGIEKGIGVGVVLSLAMVIFKTTKPHIAVLANVPGTHFYRNIKRFTNLVPRKEMLIFRFDAHIYFANTNYFKESLNDLVKEKEKELKLIIIDGESINSIDSTAMHMLNEEIENYKAMGLSFALTGIKGPVRDSLDKGGIIDKVGYENCFMSIQEAVDAFDNRLDIKNESDNLDSYIQQTND